MLAPYIEYSIVKLEFKNMKQIAVAEDSTVVHSSCLTKKDTQLKRNLMGIPTSFY